MSTWNEPRGQATSTGGPYVEALGGKLEIIADFGDRRVVLS